LLSNLYLKILIFYAVVTFIKLVSKTLLKDSLLAQAMVGVVDGVGELIRVSVRFWVQLNVAFIV
jgi:hypothetical protein